MCEDTFLDRAWLSLVDPVPHSIRSEGKAIYGISVDFVIEPSIELKEDTEASVGKDSMCRSGENMMVRKPLQ